MKKAIGDLTLNELKNVCKRSPKENYTFCINSHCVFYDVCEICLETLKDKDYEEILKKEVEVEE